MKRLLAVLGGSAAVGGLGWLLLTRDDTVDTDSTGELMTTTPDLKKGSSNLGERAVEVLSRYVGVKGKGKKGTPGYHRGDVIDTIQRGVGSRFGDRLLGQPWCGLAGLYGYETAAQELGRESPFDAKIARSLAAAKNWASGPLAPYKLSAPKVGAAVIIKTSWGHHIVLVAKPLDGQRFISIEGNHNDTMANVKRTVNPAKDVIIDVEAWANRNLKAAPPNLAGLEGLDFLGTTTSKERT